MKPYQEFTISDYQQGYVATPTEYCCVFCQETFDKEEIFYSKKTNDAAYY